MTPPTDEQQRVIEELKKAQSFAVTHPAVALNLARQTAEGVCTLLYTAYAAENPTVNEFKKPPEKQMLNGMVSSLERVNRYPKIVADALRTIRDYGNMGSHYQGEQADHVTAESIQPGMFALDTLMTWYAQDQVIDIAQVVSTKPVTRPDSSAVSAVTATVTAPAPTNRVRNLLVGAAALVGLLSAVAGLFADSISTLEQLSDAEAPALTAARASVNAVFDKLSAPHPPPACVGDDATMLGRTAKAGEMLQGRKPGGARPQDQDARKALASITAEAPGSAVAMALLAEAELAVGAQPFQVVKTARVASKLCPDWGVPANLEGNALFHAEDLDGAEVAYRTALGLAPGIASTQFNMALIQIKRSDLAGGETALNSLLDAHPHHPNARLLRSQVRLQRKNLDGALDDARHAVAADAASAAAHALLGSVLTQTGAAEAGREALCKARALGHPSGAKLCPSTP